MLAEGPVRVPVLVPALALVVEQQLATVAQPQLMPAQRSGLMTISIATSLKLAPAPAEPVVLLPDVAPVQSFPACRADLVRVPALGDVGVGRGS